MRNKIFFNILNIKPSESKHVFDLLSIQFFVGSANAFINIVGFTLFIYTFSIKELPVAYLGIAVLLFILNVVYEKSEHALSPLQLFKVTIAFSLAVLIFLWFGLSFWHKDVFFFLLLTCSTLIYMITSYAFWGMVSLLFNVRESKRVFSVVGAGDIPAKLIGYLFAPLLIPLFGIVNLLWLSIVSMVVALLVFNRTIRKKSWDGIRKKSNAEAEKPAQHAHWKKTDLVAFFFKNRLIFSISLLSIISYNVFILIDYTFITQVKLRFEDIAELAKYIAVFFALGRFIALIFKLIFTSRLIERSGIIFCLFITPVALFLFCLLFFIYGNEANFNILTFGVMAMLTEILRSTIQEPVFFILFQPLKEPLRLKGHIISKGYMFPPPLIIVGVTLFVLYKAGIPITIALTIKLLLANLIVWTLIIFLIKRTYLKTVHSSIRRGTFTSDELHVYDKKVFDLLLDKVKHGRKNEVIYSLRLLEKGNYIHISNILEEELYNSESEIRKYALEQLDSRNEIDVDVLKSMLPRENDMQIKQKIVSLLCRHDPGYLKTASENLNAYNKDLRKIIIINLLNQREFMYLSRAGNEINSLIFSGDCKDRELAINIISEIQHLQFTDAIGQLINDPDPSVKRAAVIAACKLKVAKLLPVIIDLLNGAETKYLAIKALNQYGETLFADLQNLPPDVLSSHTADLIKIAGKVKGNLSAIFLLSNIDDLSFTAEKIYHALWSNEFRAGSKDELENLHRSLDKYLNNGIEKMNNYYQVPDFRDDDIVKRAIFSEIKSHLISALKISSMIFGKKEINRIVELVQSDKIHMLYNAMEMLELLLPKNISRRMNALFDFVLEPGITNKIFEKHDIRTFFNKVILNNSVPCNPWTKAVYMYYSWKNHEISIFRNSGNGPDVNEHFIVKETRDFVISEINN